MRKKGLIALIALVLLAGAAFEASAQMRLDADVNVPIYLGYSVGGVQDGAWNQYFIPFPDVQFGYQFGLGPVSIIPGVRVFTVIIENFLYPQLTAELTLDRFVAHVGVGGFLLVEFGLLTSLLQSAGINTLTGWHNVLLSDVGVALKANDWFQIAAGVFIISPFDSSIGGVLENNVFAGYIDAKFVVYFR